MTVVHGVAIRQSPTSHPNTNRGYAWIDFVFRNGSSSLRMKPKMVPISMWVASDIFEPRRPVRSSGKSKRARMGNLRMRFRWLVCLFLI